MAELRKDMFYVAADCVVFTILDNDFKILLIKRKNAPYAGKFALPGGFVEIHESLEEGAKRELEEETGVKNVFLKQIGAYGDVKRDSRGRVVSVAFLAIINAEKIKLNATSDAELAKWHEFYPLPELAFDHKDIIKDAIAQLRSQLFVSDIASNIMPSKFTMAELKHAYEIILNKKLDKRNFYKKMKEFEILVALNETKMEGAHRPAQVFCFKK